MKGAPSRPGSYPPRRRGARRLRLPEASVTGRPRLAHGRVRPDPADGQPEAEGTGEGPLAPVRLLGDGHAIRRRDPPACGRRYRELWAPAARPARVPASPRLRPPLLRQRLRRPQRAGGATGKPRLAIPGLGAAPPSAPAGLGKIRSTRRSMYCPQSRATARRRKGLDGEIVASTQNSGQGALAPHDRPQRVVAARRRQTSSSAMARKRLRARRADGKTTGAHTGGGSRARPQYAAAASFVGSYDHHVYALGARTGKFWKAPAPAPRRPGHVLLHACGRVRPRLHRLDRRQGLLLRRHSGKLAGRTAQGLRLRLAGHLEPAGARRVLQRRSSRRRRDRRHSAGVQGERPDLGLGDVIDGVVYFATLKERTYALDARTGHMLWSFADGRYAPVADQNHLYLVGYAKVYGFNRWSLTRTSNEGVRGPRFPARSTAASSSA